ncbi:MAG: YfhO family protein, partial [Gemmatimonadota bacterium]|nr:YfhO family protein [Gemmatimonadota bacterium]
MILTPSLAQPDAPRFAFAWASLVCVLAALTLAHPALSGGFLVAPVSDQYIAGYAFREFAAASLRAGNGFPLWNPYLMGGMPYVAAMHGDIFYPTFLLRLVLPTDAAMTWGMILHLMLAGVAGYAFLRALRIGFHAALLGGLAYMMSGQVASLVSPGHDGKLFVSALFPLTLLVLTWGIRDGKRWAWGLLALVVGLGVLSPHPQLLQYLLLGSGAWALMLALGGTGDDALTRTQALQRLGFAMGAVLLGAAIGAIQYLPVREYVAWSPRVGGRDYEYATSFSMPIEELINTYLPQFSGILSEYWGRNGIHLHSEYLGAGVLALAAAGLGALGVALRRRLVLFWTGVLVVSLLWALGGNTPFYHLVYAIVPGSKFFRAPSTIYFITTFAVSVLAAMGAERALAGQVSRRLLVGALALGGGVALLASVGLFEALAVNVSVITQLSGNIATNASAVIVGAWRSLLFLGATVAVVYAINVRRIVPALGGWLLAALVVADLWSVERLYFNFSPPAAEIYATDAAIAHIRADSQPVRVIAAAFGEGAAYHDPFLDGDALMSHDVRSVLGYHGNEIRYWQGLAGKASRYDQLFNPAFWGLANVKYFYTNVDSLPFGDARRVVGPVRNAAGTMVSLFELPEPHPYAWVVPVIAKYPDAAVSEAVRAPNFPYRSVALIDTASTTPAVALTAIPAPLAITTRVTDYGPGHATIELSDPAPAGSALIASESFYPGWTATVDGQPAKAERADLALIGVALPAGARRVELRFDSP